MLRELLAVAAGGALGSAGRYLVSYVLLPGHTLWGFPAGTFAVNAAGSLLIGVLLEAAVARPYAWLLAVGFCGGFTTFSTFSADVVRLLRAGDLLPAAGCAALSLTVCTGCTALGMWAGGAWGGR